MRELVLLPGTVLTIDVTTSPVSLVCTKIDAAIHRKLFKVLAAHLDTSEITVVSPAQRPLLDAALQRFNVLPDVWEDVVQSLGDSLRAGVSPVALRCTTCGAWHVDSGPAAVHPSRVRTCPACGTVFYSAYPVVSHPLSLLQPKLQGTHLQFQL